MPQIQIARYNNLLGRLLSMAGLEATAADLSPEISPVIVMESDRPEWLFLSGQRRIGFVSSQNAGAAAPVVRLRNPVGSGVLAVIEKIGGMVEAALMRVNLQIGGDIGDLTTVSPGFQLDSRYGFAQGGSALICSAEALGAVSVGNGIEIAFPSANVPYKFLQTPLILAPGSHVDISLSAIGAFQAIVQWRERELQKYEVSTGTG